MIHSTFHDGLLSPCDSKCIAQKFCYTLSRTSMRLRLTLSSQPYGRKVPMFNEISGIQLLGASFHPLHNLISTFNKQNIYFYLQIMFMLMMSERCFRRRTQEAGISSRRAGQGHLIQFVAREYAHRNDRQLISSADPDIKGVLSALRHFTQQG
jgi:hypothetical protein